MSSKNLLPSGLYRRLRLLTESTFRVNYGRVTGSGERGSHTAGQELFGRRLAVRTHHAPKID